MTIEGYADDGVTLKPAPKSYAANVITAEPEYRGNRKPWRIRDPEPTTEQRLASLEQRVAELEAGKR